MAVWRGALPGTLRLRVCLDVLQQVYRLFASIGRSSPFVLSPVLQIDLCAFEVHSYFKRFLFPFHFPFPLIYSYIRTFKRKKRLLFLLSTSRLFGTFLCRTVCTVRSPGSPSLFLFLFSSQSFFIPLHCFHVLLFCQLFCWLDPFNGSTLLFSSALVLFFLSQ